MHKYLWNISSGKTSGAELEGNGHWPRWPDDTVGVMAWTDRFRRVSMAIQVYRNEYFESRGTYIHTYAITSGAELEGNGHWPDGQTTQWGGWMDRQLSKSFDGNPSLQKCIF